MKKIILALALVLICVLLTGCAMVDRMGDRFIEIESDGNIAICYCRDTMAVYIIYRGPFKFGMSPYIMFDEFNQATVGKWNGKEIVPAELEVTETYLVTASNQNGG